MMADEEVSTVDINQTTSNIPTQPQKASSAPTAEAAVEATATNSSENPSDVILNFEDEHDSDEDGPKSSAENIIPMKKLRNGWNQFSAFVTAQATIAHQKAVEFSNSEAAQNFKKKASETLEKTVEVAKPYWEKTVEVSAPYVEKAKENAAILQEKAKPHVEEGMKAVTEAAVKAAEITTEFVNNVTKAHPGAGSSAGRGQSSNPNMTV
jgi:hypothetical protein